MKDDAIYLRHILEAIRRVEANASIGHDAFLASHTAQDAVLRNLQTMAEASQRLSAAAKERQPGVDWRALSGFRNVLVHNYLGIDIEQVWIVIERDVPDLKAAAADLLEQHEC